MMKARLLIAFAGLTFIAMTTEGQEPRRGGARLVDDPHRLVSGEALLATVTDLAAIRAFDGFRSSASPGEAEALDLVAARLAAMPHLVALGLELERQSFRMPFGIVPRESRLVVRLDGAEHELPASASAIMMPTLAEAMTCDSDGVVNDLDEDPVVVDAPVVAVATIDAAETLDAAAVAGRVVVVRFAAVDTAASVDGADFRRRRNACRHLAGLGAEAVVLVTEYSTAPDDGRGGGAISTPPIATAEGIAPTTLFVRLEDGGGAGITAWEDVLRVESVLVRWDADVVNPGLSGNLTATIPGRDRSRAMVLGAHVDSTNTPGALDDASGVAALVEVARVLDRAHLTPPVDVVLCFFGSEELYLFGSAHWATTHQELVERTIAMLQVDCLLGRLDGVQPAIALEGRTAASSDDAGLPWIDYLLSLEWGQQLMSAVDSGPGSDNLSFQAFAVPNAHVIAWDPAATGYYDQIHCPYDDVPLVREELDTLVAMTHVALAAVLATPLDDPQLRPFPVPDRRALVVASHTEAPHMASVALSEFGMTLAWSGFDLDVVPFGHELTAADVVDVDLVVTLPVFDYPLPESGSASGDEAWSAAELDVLASYVDAGGLLVATHSCGMMVFGNSASDGVPSEDGPDDNVLAARFGFRFAVETDPMSSSGSVIVGNHPVVDGAAPITLGRLTGAPVEHQGETLVEEFESHLPVMAAIPVGDHGGEVLAVGDLGILADDANTWPPAPNVKLWQNLANYARGRGGAAVTGAQHTASPSSRESLARDRPDAASLVMTRSEAAERSTP